MSNSKPKTINGLMEHLRNSGVSISGSNEKNQLINMGYYHGYKGYRFFNKNTNRINYSTFKEVKKVYDFDMKLKSLLYPLVMNIETSLKNILLEIIVKECKSSNFSDIYNSILTDYKLYSTSGVTFNNAQTRVKAEKRLKAAIVKRNKTRDNIYRISSKAFENSNTIAMHFQDKESHIPIWGIFEFISLGEFGHFLSICNKDIRELMSKRLNFNQIFDTNSTMVTNCIFAIKDLRNAIAHNNPIFDTRFKTGSISTSLNSLILNETNINVDFKHIFDYIVLLVFVLKKLNVSKTELKKIVMDFNKLLDEIYTNLPNNIYSMIFLTNTRQNINLLKSYISS